MNVEGMTRENVASHLQKYRLYLKRLAGLPPNAPLSNDTLQQVQNVQKVMQHQIAAGMGVQGSLVGLVPSASPHAAAAPSSRGPPTAQPTATAATTVAANGASAVPLQVGPPPLLAPQSLPLAAQFASMPGASQLDLISNLSALMDYRIAGAGHGMAAAAAGAGAAAGQHPTVATTDGSAGVFGAQLAWCCC